MAERLLKMTFIAVLNYYLLQTKLKDIGQSLKRMK